MSCAGATAFSMPDTSYMSAGKLQDAKWENGVVTKDPVPDEACPTDEISASGSGIRQGRLYFTDGTCPNYAEAGKPMYLPGREQAAEAGTCPAHQRLGSACICEVNCMLLTQEYLELTPCSPTFSVEHCTDAEPTNTVPASQACCLPCPGLSCAFNDATNAVLPPPLRSSRGDSLLRFMRVESTGVASFTLFAPLGPGTGLTSFHQETKQRRSFNMGTGDFIIQPLAVASHVRCAA